MICCNSKEVDRAMLSCHSLANQIAGKPIRISCHKITCWYELTMQFCGASTGMVEWPSSWGIGCYVCASRNNGCHRQNQGSIYFGVGKLLSKNLNSLPPPKKKKRKKIGKSIKNGVSLMKRMFSRKKRMVCFEKEIFPSKNGVV